MLSHPTSPPRVADPARGNVVSREMELSYPIYGIMHGITHTAAVHGTKVGISTALENSYDRLRHCPGCGKESTY